MAAKKNPAKMSPDELKRLKDTQEKRKKSGKPFGK